MEYAIPHKRELNAQEIEILTKILTNEKSDLLSQLRDMKVIGRCGCENCPTVLFGTSFEDKFKINKKLIFDYFGKTANDEAIGISILGDETGISEMEFYSMDGQLENCVYPMLETIKKV